MWLNYVRLLIILLVLIIPIYIVFSFFKNNYIPVNLNPSNSSSSAKKTKMTPLWEVRSVDTVKYSRDVAREKENDPSYDEVINLQVKNIANLGATHVAIGTP